MGYYPIMIDLAGKKCLIVGGGHVAYRKALSLLDAGAEITVISPEICSELEQIDNITIKKRPYRTGDIKDFVLVFAATGDSALNAEISEDATKMGRQVNVVDDPELCSFIVPAIIRRGSLLIAITTSGKSPALAKKIRLEMEREYGPEYAEFVDLLGEIRDEVKKRYTTQQDREAVFDRLIESGILQVLKDGRKEQAREMALRCI